MEFSRKSLLVAAVAVAAFSTSALAESPRYNFGDVSYSSISDPSGSGLSSDHAFGLGGSYAFNDQVIGIASYAHESADFNLFGTSGSLSGDIYSIGAGYRFALKENIDLIPNISYVSESASAVGVSTTDTGFNAGVQLRAVVAPQWEVEGSVGHSSVGSDSTTVGIGALYDFTPKFSLGFGYENESTSGDNFNSWTLALRYYFK